MKRKSRIFGKHRKGCLAVAAVKQGHWSTPWSGVIQTSYFGNVLGTKGRGHTYWHVVTCNDTRCTATKAVNSEVLNRA